MYDMYGDRDKFTNELNKGLPQQAWGEKQSMEWKHTDSLLKKGFGRCDQ